MHRSSSSSSSPHLKRQSFVTNSIDLLNQQAASETYNYTPLWTAPEVLTGTYNGKVDIWALGCVIIEMASGKPPWHEKNFSHPFIALWHIGNEHEIPLVPIDFATWQLLVDDLDLC